MTTTLNPAADAAFAAYLADHAADLIAFADTIETNAAHRPPAVASRLLAAAADFRTTATTTLANIAADAAKLA